LLGIDDTKTIVVAELDMHILEQYTTNKALTTAYQTLQDQIITRDLSFVIKKTDHYGTVADAIRSLEAVQTVEIIDIYTGPQLAHDEKSISLRFQIQGDGTLTTEQINAIMQQAIVAAEEKGATLRG
jgi:phenylalanyl-tRNA synthetase beta chain